MATDPAFRDAVGCHAEPLLRRLTLTERNGWNSGAATIPPELDQYGLSVSASTGDTAPQFTSPLRKY